MIQSYLKGKSAIQFTSNEDFKTSSSIGLLQYLPDDVFWRIIRNSCVGLDIADFGEILSFNFWEHTASEGTTNQNFVEPDVWIETEKVDVIIEAKLSDTFGQYEHQWKNEIQSILNEQRGNEYQKRIVLIALGGNADLQPDSVKVEKTPYSVYKASWFALVNAIVTEKNQDLNSGSVCRVLEDVIELFARQGVMALTWLNSLPNYSVNENALRPWKRHDAMSSEGFAHFSSMSIDNQNIQEWEPSK